MSKQTANFKVPWHTWLQGALRDWLLCVDDDFAPKRCWRCGCPESVQHTTDRLDGHTIMEFDVYCVECGFACGCWAYGCWMGWAPTWREIGHLLIRQPRRWWATAKRAYRKHIHGLGVVEALSEKQMYWYIGVLCGNPNGLDVRDYIRDASWLGTAVIQQPRLLDNPNLPTNRWTAELVLSALLQRPSLVTHPKLPFERLALPQWHVLLEKHPQLGSYTEVERYLLMLGV